MIENEICSSEFLVVQIPLKGERKKRFLQIKAQTGYTSAAVGRLLMDSGFSEFENAGCLKVRQK